MTGAEAGLFAGANVGSSLLGGMLSGGQSRGSAKRARKFTREVMQNQMQWKAADLQKAGLNPILAMSPGGAPSSPGAHMGQSPGYDTSIDFSQLQTSAKERKLKGAQTSVQKATNELVQANAKDASNKARISEAEADLIEKELNQLKSDPDNFNAYLMRKYIGTPGWAGGMGLIGREGKEQGQSAFRTFWNWLKAQEPVQQETHHYKPSKVQKATKAARKAKR